MNKQKGVRYSDTELEEFRPWVEEKLAKAREDYKQLKDALDHSDGNDIRDTSPTHKYSEDGASNASEALNSRLAQRQAKLIQNLEAAIVRIENKTYGICRETGNLIPKFRLKATPHATLCIEAKEKGN